MEFIDSLWLPILLSAVAVWIASIVLGLPFFHHKTDWIGLPKGQEDALASFLRTSDVRPGNYLFPDFRTREAMESERVKKALNDGPVGHLSLWPTPLGMGGKMAATFVVYLIVNTLIAYLTRVAIPGPASFARVFQVAGAAGVLAYGFAHLPSAIWWGAYRRTIVANVIDGMIYGCITGAIFAWRWPQ